MKINKLNYEVYIIDYIEGTLPDNMVAEVEQFLLLHPEIAKDVSMFDEIVLSPDPSVKYIAKDNLRKPIQFSILQYMNWIVPISMSILFMIAYPYINTMMNKDKAPQQEEQPTDKSEKNKSSEEAYNPTDYSLVTPPNLANNNNISTPQNSQNQSASPQNNITKNSNPYPTLTSKNKLENRQNNKSVNISKVQDNGNSTQPIMAEYAHNDEEKSIVAIGNKDYNLNPPVSIADAPMKALEICPLESISSTSTSSDWNIDDLKMETPVFRPYLTLTVLPYGFGYDMAKTTSINSNNTLIRNIPLDTESEIVIKNPQQFSLEANVHLSKFVKISSGFSMMNRELVYQTNNGSLATPNLGIRYRTFAIPLNASFRMPVNNSQHDAIVLQGGGTAYLMGSRNYSLDPNSGIATEKGSTASLIRAADFEDKMVTTDGSLKIVPGVQFGLAYEKTLRKGQLSFGVQYSRQLSNINTITVWDYDLNTASRSNPQDYNMRFETIMAMVKYTLPLKYNLKN